MRKKLLVIFAILMGIYLGVGNYFYNVALNSSTKKEKITRQDKDEKFDEELVENIKWFHENLIEIEMDSVVKAKLKGYIFENENKKDWVVVVHGYNSSSEEVSTHIREFYNMGYSVFSPDLLSFGKSKGKFTSMGKYESEDLVNWLNILSDKYSDAKFVLFGRSMGAATVLNTLDKGIEDKVIAFISDSGYLKLEDIYIYQLKKMYNLPYQPILPAFKAVTSLRAKFDISKVDATKKLQNTKIPGMFLHGENDTFVLPEESIKGHELLNSMKEIHIFEDSKHVQAHFIHKEKYWSVIKKFLERVQ